MIYFILFIFSKYDLYLNIFSLNCMKFHDFFTALLVKPPRNYFIITRVAHDSSDAHWEASLLNRFPKTVVTKHVSDTDSIGDSN